MKLINRSLIILNKTMSQYLDYKKKFSKEKIRLYLVLIS